MNFPLLSAHIPEGTSHRFIQQSTGCQRCECVASAKTAATRALKKALLPGYGQKGKSYYTEIIRQVTLPTRIQAVELFRHDLRMDK